MNRPALHSYRSRSHRAVTRDPATSPVSFQAIAGDRPYSGDGPSGGDALPPPSSGAMPPMTSQGEAFFNDLLDCTLPNTGETALVMVTHVLPDKTLFIDALSRRFARLAIVPKPHSIHAPTLHRLAEAHTILRIGKETFAHASDVAAQMNGIADGCRLLIADMGGYFAQALTQWPDDLQRRVAGVVEDTENGHRRYEAVTALLPCPVLSVARSLAKETEDVLVGESIAFSIDAILRSNGMLPNGRRHLVIGFGRVGRNAASALARRGVSVTVFDRDPLKVTSALAHGFRIADRRSALEEADVIVCATGAGALSVADLDGLRDHCLIAAATSPDDEFAFAGIDEAFTTESGGHLISTLRRKGGGKTVHLLNGGNTVNFAHGGVVGPHLHLVQGVIAEAMTQLLHHPPADGLHELGLEAQRRAATLWLRHFGGAGA